MIELLPSNIANQIAAGEVVQRGASIVKELVENAIDAGATRIAIRIEDGGRTLIQVVDNGCGMSAVDAPKAFLRHATSKIRTIEELFALRTFGFRGEALASISSVAEVELVSRRCEDEVGVRIIMRDGVEVENSICSAAVGTSITVRNLFFSVPARRKFLKSDSYETKLCKSEFIRVALINEGVGFEYYSGDTQVVLMPQSRLARVVALTRSSYAKKLLPIKVDSPIVNIKGFISTPDSAKSKGRGDQYLFVNGRYFRNNRIFKALCDAYGRLIAQGTAPNYFLYLNVEPDRVDVNINPTKTEVKFEDEDSIVQIVASAVKQTLGKHNVVEAIDFDAPQIEIPSYSPQREFVEMPKITDGTTSSYNPFASSGWGFENEVPEDFDAQKAHFDEDFIFSEVGGVDAIRELSRKYAASSSDRQEGFMQGFSASGESLPPSNEFSATPISNWESTPNHETMISSLSEQDSQVKQEVQTSEDIVDIESEYKTLQILGNRYLAYDSVDGLVLININRARQRIEYEAIVGASHREMTSSQILVIPESVELNQEQKSEVMANLDVYSALGFTVEDDGGSSVRLCALPVGFTSDDFIGLVTDSSTVSIEQRLAMARVASIANQSSRKLVGREIEVLLQRLMSCDEPSYTPTGLKIIEILSDSDVEKRFKR